MPHLAGATLRVDGGHVGHAAQALHAVSLPASHRLRQDLELQVLTLPQVLALRLRSTVKQCWYIIGLNSIWVLQFNLNIETVKQKKTPFCKLYYIYYLLLKS